MPRSNGWSFAVAIVVACAPAASRAAEPPAIETPALRVLFPSAPTVLDPHRTVSVVNGWYLDNAFEPLFRLDSEGAIVPLLATEVREAGDGTWLVRLRDGVRFHDGRRLEVADVVASLRRAAAGGLSGVVASGTDDPGVVRLTTNLPRPAWQGALTLMPILPADSPTEITEPNGTGPFRLEVVESGRRYRLTAFAGYWGEAPTLPGVDIVVEPNGATRVERLLAGEVDFVAGVPGSLLPTIDENRDFWVATCVGTAVAFAALDACRPPLSDPRLREAIDLAIDREQIAERLEHLVRATGQLLTPAMLGYDPTVEPPASDLEVSRRLLAEAGHGEGLELRLVHSPGAGSIAAEVAAQLAAVGVRARLEEIAADQLMVAGQAEAGSLVMAYHFGAPGDPIAGLAALLGTPGSSPGRGTRNYAHCGSPEMEAALDRASARQESASRRQAFAGISELAREQRILLPLVWGVDLFGLRSDLEWTPRVDGRVLFAELERR